MFKKYLSTTIFLLLLSLGTTQAQGKFCFQGATIKAQSGTPGLVYQDTALNTPEIIRFSTRPQVSPYQYLVTDTNNIIVQVSASNSIDISGLTAGSYRVWSFSYIGTITAEVGQDAGAVQLAAFCSGLSRNFVPFVINSSEPDNGDGGDTGGGDNGAGNGEGPDPDVVISYGTVLEAIERSSLLQVLERGVENAGLEDDLAGEGPLTVFAPVNNAFAALDPADLVALFDLPTTALRTTILNHVVAGSYAAADLFNGQVLTTLAGHSLPVIVNDEGVFVGGAKVVQTDIGAENGIVHLIQNIVESIAP
ncbi:MAG: fasciclin domain-containing protein [Saprospiraceae bacterium]|nr:fasciclin domain-containing protein [Saprospiraceae bacterium]